KCEKKVEKYTNLNWFNSEIEEEDSEKKTETVPLTEREIKPKEIMKWKEKAHELTIQLIKKEMEIETIKAEKKFHIQTKKKKIKKIIPMKMRSYCLIQK
ncbi:MAG: hypothetical protein LBB09_00210, partial [Rickettsiales bacterium]|nr:hypothetical protein [Rickettsiales bacterium]